MTTEQVSPVTGQSVEDALVRFLESKTNTVVSPERDLFASGLVTSMFAMQLVVHLEAEYSVAIVGSNLNLDNFRSVRNMTALVLRLHAEQAAAEGV